MLLASPGRFLCALALAIPHGAARPARLPYHLAYLGRACRLLPWLKSAARCTCMRTSGPIRRKSRCWRARWADPRTASPCTAGGVRPAAASRPRREGACARHSWWHQLVWPQPALSLGRARAVAESQDRHCGLEPAFHDIAPRPPPAAPRLVCVAGCASRRPAATGRSGRPSRRAGPALRAGSRR